MKTKLTVILFCLFVQFSSAQNAIKIGHVNIQEIVQNHPLADSLRKVLEAETKDMEDLYNEMLREHDSKLQVYEKEKAGYSEFVRNSKEKELGEMAQKIQNYNQSAQQQLQLRNMELLQPVYDQINTVIAEIAANSSFSYILDIGSGAVAYVAPTSENITPQVLNRLKKK